MRGSWPGQGSGVVDHQRQVAAAGFGVPPHALVPRRDLPSCGAEAEDGEGFAIGGPDEVAHLRTGQRRVAEVASDELVPEAAFVRVPAGIDNDGLDVGETFGGRDRRLVGRGAGHGRTAHGRRLPRRRQDDQAVAVHAQHGDARARHPWGSPLLGLLHGDFRSHACFLHQEGYRDPTAASQRRSQNTAIPAKVRTL